MVVGKGSKIPKNRWFSEVNYIYFYYLQTTITMKKDIAICMTCLFWLALPCTVFAQENKEIAAIKSAIEKETTAFFQVDNKTWMDSWVHAPYTFWSMADSSGFNTFNGWKAIEIGFTDYFLTNRPSTASIVRQWHDIRVYGNGAFARFNQFTTTDGVTSSQEEIRVLEKHDGKWKIVLVGVMKGSQKVN
jgi:hypothetical protein